MISSGEDHRNGSPCQNPLARPSLSQSLGPLAREGQLQGPHICESFENFMMNKNYLLHRLMHYILTQYRYDHTIAGLLLLCTFFLMTLTPIINSDIENVDYPVTRHKIPHSLRGQTLNNDDNKYGLCLRAEERRGSPQPRKAWKENFGFSIK